MHEVPYNERALQLEEGHPHIHILSSLHFTTLLYNFAVLSQVYAVKLDFPIKQTLYSFTFSSLEVSFSSGISSTRYCIGKGKY